MSEELTKQVIAIIEKQAASLSDEDRKSITKWLGQSDTAGIPGVRSLPELNIALDRVAPHIGNAAAVQLKALATQRNAPQIANAVLFALLSVGSKKPEASL